MKIFCLNLTMDKLMLMYDNYGDISFHKLFEWMVPKFGDVKTFYECLAAKMWNYMVYCIQTKGFTPKYFDPADEKYIQVDHVANFFGCQLAQSLWGNPSIDQCWLTRELLDTIGMCVESMPRNAFKDIYCYMHFVDDDWDVEEGSDDWDETYTDKKSAVQMTRLTIAISLQFLRMVLIVAGKIASSLDAGSPLMRA